MYWVDLTGIYPFQESYAEGLQVQHELYVRMEYLYAILRVFSNYCVCCAGTILIDTAL